MKKIHIVTALSRLNLVLTLIECYQKMDVIWHPIMFMDESIKVDRVIYEYNWIQPHVIKRIYENNLFTNGYRKKNSFIKEYYIANDDYYCILDDDDMIEEKTIREIKFMDDDVIFISMKRGHNIPDNIPIERKYPTSTLEAKPDNISIGNVGQQQYIVKGKIFKKLRFNENYHCADGEMAVWLKEHYEVSYQPQLYVLFNYFEEGRWNKENIKEVH